MKTRVSQWGNSLGVRIPKVLAEQLGLSNKTELEMKLEEDAIILKKPKNRLEDLLSQVTSGNCHREMDSGKPVGKELW